MTLAPGRVQNVSVAEEPSKRPRQSHLTLGRDTKARFDSKWLKIVPIGVETSEESYNRAKDDQIRRKDETGPQHFATKGLFIRTV